LYKFLKLTGHDLFFIDCLDKSLPYFKNRSLYKDGQTKENGTGKFFKYERELPEILGKTNIRYFHFGLSKSDFSDILNNYTEFDYVFIQMTFSFHYLSLIEILGHLRMHSGKAKIILGGLYPTLHEEHALTLGFDHVIKGGWENIIQFLLTEKLIPSLQYIDDLFFSLQISKGINIKNQLQGQKKSLFLDSFIQPEWGLYPFLNYGILRTSLGCPFHCPYCASSFIDPGYSALSKENIISQLEYFKQRGIKHIAFYDDALLLNKNRIIELFREIEKMKYPFDFYLPNAVHIKYLDEEILYFFNLLNFKMIRFGFETSDRKMGEKRGDKFSDKEMERLFQLLENNEINREYLKFYILIGLPDQTEEEVKETINYVLDKGYRTYFAYYSPIPHTPYYDYIMSQERRGDLVNPVHDPLWQNPAIYTYFNTRFTESKIKEWKRQIIQNNKVK